MYRVPFTRAGDDDTMESSVNPDQSSLQKFWPQPAAGNASTSLVFRPTYTTPLATIGEETMAACAPSPKPVHSGSQLLCPHPAAGKTYNCPSSAPTYTWPLATAGVESTKLFVLPVHRGLQVAPPQPVAANA